MCNVFAQHFHSLWKSSIQTSPTPNESCDVMTIVFVFMFFHFAELQNKKSQFSELIVILILCQIIECEKWFLNACLEDGSTWIMKNLLVRKYTNSCSDWSLRFVENAWFVLEFYLKIVLKMGISSCVGVSWVTWVSNSKHFENSFRSVISALKIFGILKILKIYRGSEIRRELIKL